MKRIKQVLLLLFVLGGIVFGQIFPQASLAVTKSLYIAEAKQANFTPILKIDPSLVDGTVSNYMYAALGYLAVTNMNVVGYIKDIRTFVVYYVDVQHNNEMLAFMSPTGERTYVAQAGNNGTIVSDSYFIRPMTTFIISYSYLENILAAEQIYMLGVNKAIKIKINESLLKSIDRSGVQKAREQKELANLGAKEQLMKSIIDNKIVEGRAILFPVKLKFEYKPNSYSTEFTPQNCYIIISSFNDNNIEGSLVIENGMYLFDNYGKRDVIFDEVGKSYIKYADYKISVTADNVTDINYEKQDDNLLLIFEDVSKFKQALSTLKVGKYSLSSIYSDYVGREFVMLELSDIIDECINAYKNN